MLSFHRLIAAVLVSACCAAQAAPGLVDVPSAHETKLTMDRLEDFAKQRGLTIFARIDHGANAAKVGRALRPTELLIFGNPQGGTALMACAQTSGIDLPLKALVWEDAAGKVWLSYNDPGYLAQRHDASAWLDRAERVLAVLRDSRQLRAATQLQWRQLGRRSLFDVMGAESERCNLRIAEVNALIDAIE